MSYIFNNKKLREQLDRLTESNHEFSPHLIKIPSKEYYVGCDVSKIGNNEVLSFCVIYREKGRSIIAHSDQITILPKDGMSVEDHIDRLSKFYNVTIIKEKL